MTKFVFRQKRKQDGRGVTSRLYYGRFRVDGMLKRETVSLDVSDKDVARRKLDEIVRQRERELAGLTVPAAASKAAARPIQEHAACFVTDLQTKGRAAKYCRNVGVRLNRLFAECGWRVLGEASTQSFLKWRTSQAETLSGKTLNDYLSLARTFFGWCERQQLLAADPLRHLETADTRGRATLNRRALADGELRKLIEAAGEERGLVYLFAARTGLRRGEIRTLRWHDLHLDAPEPYLMTRASTSKNRREQALPLSPELYEAFMKRNTQRHDAGDLVFPVVPKMPRFLKDVGNAGIDRKDSLGRIVDFHCLRHTYCTHLLANGASLRVTQLLMRHSDPKLTGKDYLDESLLPAREEIRRLPRLDSPTHDTPGRTPNQGAGGHLLSQQVTKEAAKVFLQPVDVDAPSRGKSGGVTVGRMVRAAGFEPATPTV